MTNRDLIMIKLIQLSTKEFASELKQLTADIKETIDAMK